MTAGSISAFSRWINPAWLTGPIFDKELRVSSRRLRNYVLRSGYIILLSVFILSIWYSIFGIRRSGSAVYLVSRASQAGKYIITTTVWFQFLVTQLIAVVMLSSAISDEIRAGTLSVLMTTPINSFQIVTGKLLSKLLQLMLLLAISLPLLAVIRVFGGVQWDYIVSSVCITLTAALLVGSLSLLLSMTYRHAYNVILITIVGCLLIFGALPALFSWLATIGIFNQQVTQSVIALTNPFWALFRCTSAMVSTPGRGLTFFSWPMHCLITLAVTAVLIAISVCRVRKAALCEAFGRPRKLWSWRALKPKDRGTIVNTGSQSPVGSIIPIGVSPIVWKEMRRGFLGGKERASAISLLLIGLFFLTAILLLFSPKKNMFFMIFGYYFVSVLYLVVMIRLAVLSASSIAGEKEARTWPILLATPLADREIVRAKAIAAFRKSIPLLVVYLALLCIYYSRLGMYKSPGFVGMLLTTTVGLVASVPFVIGGGLYFGVRFRTAAAAIAATVGSYLAVRYLLCGTFNPLRIVLYMTIARLYSPGNPSAMMWVYYSTTVAFSLVQAGIGLFLGRCAVRRLRRNIF
jgi:ABC-2 type transport system permease protein